MLDHQPPEPELPVAIPQGRRIDLGGRGHGFVRVALGDGERPVLLLHGLTASSGINWLNVFPALAERTVLAPDLRGHARGPTASRAVSIDDHVADVVALLDEAGLDSATVVGFSFGGAVAQELALQHPERVRALVLVATSPRFRMGPLTKRTYGITSTAARAARALPASVHDVLAPRFVPSPDPEIRRFVLSETCLHRRSQLVRNAKGLSRFRTTPRLGQITTPTAVMVTTSDTTVHPNAQRRLVSDIPDAALVESPTGHSGLLWESETAVPKLLEALRLAEERSSTR